MEESSPEQQRQTDDTDRQIGSKQERSMVLIKVHGRTRNAAILNSFQLDACGSGGAIEPLNLLLVLLHVVESCIIHQPCTVLGLLYTSVVLVSRLVYVVQWKCLWQYSPST